MGRSVFISCSFRHDSPDEQTAACRYQPRLAVIPATLVLLLVFSVSSLIRRCQPVTEETGIALHLSPAPPPSPSTVQLISILPPLRPATRLAAALPPPALVPSYASLPFSSLHSGGSPARLFLMNPCRLSCPLHIPLIVHTRSPKKNKKKTH